MARRPDVRIEWIEYALKKPIRAEVQTNGQIWYWAFIPDIRKFLRVVTERDGKTVHHAFFDRRFKG